MKEILKLNLVDSGIPGFVLKRNIIGKELVVDKKGNIVEKNVYKVDEKFCKERYNSIVNLLPRFNGVLVLYGVRENGKKERIEYINCNGELRSGFNKSVKDGMGRYEWMKKKLTEVKYELVDSKLKKVKYKRIDFNLGVKV